MEIFTDLLQVLLLSPTSLTPLYQIRYEATVCAIAYVTVGILRFIGLFDAVQTERLVMFET